MKYPNSCVDGDDNLNNEGIIVRGGARIRSRAKAKGTMVEHLGMVDGKVVVNDGKMTGVLADVVGVI